MTSVGDRQVACHPPDDHDLLRVLLPEVGVLGADQVEQDGDDGRDAVEMTRPGGALERARDRPDADDRVEAGRIDLRRVGGEDDVDTLRLADREVARLVARVLHEVVGDVELARVDEDRDDGGRVVRAGDLHQRPVAVVEPAHRRHEPDRAAARPAARPAGRRAFERSGSSGPARCSEVAIERDAARGHRTRRPVGRAAAEDLVEDRLVHPHGLLGARERAGGDVGRVGARPRPGSRRGRGGTAWRASG